MVVSSVVAIVVSGRCLMGAAVANAAGLLFLFMGAAVVVDGCCCCCCHSCGWMLAVVFNGSSLMQHC